MSISLNDNIRVNAGKPVDGKYLNLSNVPYTGTSQVFSQIPIGERHIGQTVNVNNIEYYFETGVTNNALVIKTATATSQLFIVDAVSNVQDIPLSGLTQSLQPSLNNAFIDVNYKVLVTAQGVTADNGIYVVKAGNWVRINGFNTNDSIHRGAFVRTSKPGDQKYYVYEITPDIAFNLGDDGIYFTEYNSIRFEELYGYDGIVVANEAPSYTFRLGGGLSTTGATIVTNNKTFTLDASTSNGVSPFIIKVPKTGLNAPIMRFHLGSYPTAHYLDFHGSHSNIGIGQNAGSKAIYNPNLGTGSQNVIAIGESSLHTATTGSNNIGIGANALGNTNSNFNTALGHFAGELSTSFSSTFLGYGAGRNVTSAGGSIIIGSGVHAPSATLANQLNIGNVIYGLNIYSTSFFSSTPTSGGSIGIGLTTPTARLHLVSGSTILGPLKLSPGSLVSTITGGVQNGLFEYNGSHLSFIIGSTRYQLDQQTGSGSTTFATNGLTKTNNIIKLGGSITGTTTLSLTTNALNITGSTASTLTFNVGTIKLKGLQSNPLPLDGISTTYSHINYPAMVSGDTVYSRRIPLIDDQRLSARVPGIKGTGQVVMTNGSPNIVGIGTDFSNATYFGLAFWTDFWVKDSIGTWYRGAARVAVDNTHVTYNLWYSLPQITSGGTNGGYIYGLTTFPGVGGTYDWYIVQTFADNYSLSFGSHNIANNFSLCVGGNNIATGQNSIAAGNSALAAGTRAFAFGFAVAAVGNTTFAGGTGVATGGAGPTTNKRILALGNRAFIWSENNASQTVGAGALAANSAILGGLNHNIASGNVRAAIIGGSAINLTGASYIDHVAVPSLAIFTTPASGTNEDVLVWNTSNKKVWKITQASLTGNSISIGLFKINTGATNTRINTIETLYVTGATNLGVGTGLFTSVSAKKIQLKSLVAGTNITLTPSATGITITSTASGSGTTYTSSNGITKTGTNFMLGGSITGITNISLGNNLLTVTGSSSSLTRFGRVFVSGLTATTNNLGITQTAIGGLRLVNNTLAQVGAQQISPPTIWESQGWATTPVASQSVKFSAYQLPVQGAANPISSLVFASSVNGGAFSIKMSIASSGILAVATISTNTTNSPLGVRSQQTTVAGVGVQISNGAVNFTATSGIASHVAVGLVGESFAPPSGNAAFNSIILSNTFNQTGGANGQITGIRGTPTITAAVNVTGFDWEPITPNNITGTHLAIRAVSGNVLIGSTGITTNTRTDIRGSNSTTTILRLASSGNTMIFNALNSGLVGIGNITPLARLHIREATLGNVVKIVETTAISGTNPNEKQYQNRVTTTGATLTTIQTLTVPASTTYYVSGNIVVRRTGGVSGATEDGGAFKFDAVYKNAAGTATIIGSTSITTVGSSQAYAMTLITSTNTVQIKVTGINQTNLSWIVNARTVEVST